MHVIIGALVVVGTFLWAMQYMTMEFDGFLNVYSGILLGGVPIGLTILTFRFSSLGQAIRGLFRRGLPGSLGGAGRARRGRSRRPAGGRLGSM